MIDAELDAVILRLREIAMLAPEGHDKDIGIAAAAIAALRLEVARLKQELRDAKDDVQSTSIEAMWKERQGDEYGSY